MTKSKQTVKLNDWGKKYLGHKARPEDIALFLSECISKDSDIIEMAQKCAIFDAKYIDRIERIESPLNPIEEGKKANSWKQYHMIDPNNDTGEDMDQRDYILFYADKNGNPISVEDKTDFIHVYYMPEFGNDYRITIFETKEKRLFLGYFAVNLTEDEELHKDIQVEKDNQQNKINKHKI